MKKTQVTDKNTQKPRRHQKNPDLVEKNPAVATLLEFKYFLRQRGFKNGTVSS